LRADSGFARDTLMAWCENNGVDFLFGLAKNARLNAEIETELAAAQEQSQRTGKPARRFKDFTWRTLKSWSCETSMAYVLVCALRRIGLKHTQFARASCGTIRLRREAGEPGRLLA
jgi:Transposase DDE domain group 1